MILFHNFNLLQFNSDIEHEPQSLLTDRSGTVAALRIVFIKYIIHIEFKCQWSKVVTSSSIEDSTRWDILLFNDHTARHDRLAHLFRGEGCIGM